VRALVTQAIVACKTRNSARLAILAALPPSDRARLLWIMLVKATAKSDYKAPPGMQATSDWLLDQQRGGQKQRCVPTS
jgi:hypothetical protein